MLAVPLSYQPQEAAHQREVKLALTRQRAKNSHGALLFIAGGPGQVRAFRGLDAGKAVLDLAGDGGVFVG